VQKYEGRHIDVIKRRLALFYFYYTRAGRD